MVDLHSHILPGLDDGSPDLEASFAIARAARRDGVKEMVATPHVNAKYAPTGEVVRELTEKLNAALADRRIRLPIHAGAELAVSKAMGMDDAELKALTIGSSGALLIESPYAEATPFMERMLFELQLRGFRIVLAHPERCPAFQTSPERLVELVERDVICSITAGSVAGRFGRRVQGFALRLLRDGLAHNLSSDAHDVSRRPPGLRRGLVAAEQNLPGARALAAWLTEAVPTAVLDDDPLPAAPAWSPPPPSGFERLRAMLGGRR